MIAGLLFGIATAVSAATPFDVKGVQLGTTLDALRAAVGSELSCGVLSREYYEPEEDEFFDEFCKRSVPGNPLGAHDTYAGLETNIQYGIWNGKVGKIWLSSLPSSKFEFLLQGLTAKFGEPELTEQVARTRDGTEMRNRTATWHGDGVILLEELFRLNHEISMLVFYSADYWSELERRRAAAKSDM